MDLLAAALAPVMQPGAIVAVLIFVGGLTGVFLWLIADADEVR